MFSLVIHCPRVGEEQLTYKAKRVGQKGGKPSKNTQHLLTIGGIIRFHRSRNGKEMRYLPRVCLLCIFSSLHCIFILCFLQGCHVFRHKVGVVTKKPTINRVYNSNFACLKSQNKSII